MAVGMGVEEGRWLPDGHPLVPAGLGGGLGEFRVRAEPENQPAVERLERSIMRPPISLERMAWDGVGEVRYRRKRGHEGSGLPEPSSGCRVSRILPAAASP